MGHSSKKNFLKQIFLEISDNVSEIFCSSSFHSSSSQSSSIFHNDHEKEPEGHFTGITSKQVNVEQNQSNWLEDPIDDFSSNKSRQMLSKKKGRKSRRKLMQTTLIRNMMRIKTPKFLKLGKSSMSKTPEISIQIIQTLPGITGIPEKM